MSTLAGTDPTQAIRSRYPRYVRTRGSGYTTPADMRLLYLDMLIIVNFQLKPYASLRETLLDIDSRIGNIMASEETAIHWLNIAVYDIRLALKLANYANNSKGDLAVHMLKTLDVIVQSDEEETAAITSQRWFADGLTDPEAALITTLKDSRNRPLYPAIIESYSADSKEVSLPLTGDLRIWVVQQGPSLYEEAFSLVEGSVRAMERLMGVHFPTTDVILLVSEPGSGVHWQGGDAFFTYNYMEVNSSRFPAIPHETGHYYFGAAPGPGWFVEGGANFLSSFTYDSMGIQELDAQKKSVAGSVRRDCYQKEEIDNILHWEVHKFSFSGSCYYPMGEQFFLALLDAIGEGPLGAALGELYLLTEERVYLTEQLIFEAFVKHTPPDKQEALHAVYRELHGGPDLPIIADDHGDTLGEATPIALGEPATGNLDYRFDMDFFRFEAEQGRRYRINLNHGSLRRTALWVYETIAAPFGHWEHLIGGHPLGLREMHEGEWERELASTGPQILWTAPSTDDYYVSVENFAGESGPYTVTVAPAE